MYIVGFRRETRIFNMDTDKTRTSSMNTDTGHRYRQLAWIWTPGMDTNMDMNTGHRNAWWLNGSTSDCCPAVPGSNPASPQPTADCQSSGGLPPAPGMALGCGLTSVRGDGGENYENAKNI
jgi:hypothetical protein